MTLDDLRKLFDEASFSWRDLNDMDVWTPFAPTGVITVVGAESYSGRFRIVGRQCFGQIKFSAATSVATTAGTSYFTLPVAAVGLAGSGTMSNDTSNVAVGVCHVDVANSRVYLPAQVASANVFNVAVWWEV